MQSINITSVGQAADIWHTPSYSRQVIKNSIFLFFSTKEYFQKEELEIIETLKNRIRESGDNDFFERIDKVTQRLIFIQETPYTNATTLERLPSEVIQKICDKLSIVSLKNLHLVATRFAKLLNEYHYVANFQIRKIYIKEVRLRQEKLFKIMRIYGDYVKSINSHYLYYTVDDARIRAIATHCQNLQSFNIDMMYGSSYHGTIQQETLEIISKLKCLRSLVLKGCDITENGIKQVSTLTNLQSLDFTSSDIADKHLFNIEKLTNLKELFINGAEITKVGIEKLANMPNLRILSLRAVSIYDKELEVLAPLKLSTLDLAHTKIKKMTGIEAQIDLQVLLLEGTKIENEAWEKIALLTKLHTLDLSCVSITEEGLNRISRLTNLEALNLRRALPPSGKPILETLENTLVELKKISCLNLNRTGFNNKSLEKITHLTNMQDLDLSYTNIDDEGLAKIAHFTSLKNLNLDATSVGDHSINIIIPNMIALNSLNLSSTNVSTAILPNLAKLPKLECLDLCNTEIDEYSVRKNLNVNTVQSFSKFILNKNL